MQNDAWFTVLLFMIKTFVYLSLPVYTYTYIYIYLNIQTYMYKTLLWLTKYSAVPTQFFLPLESYTFRRKDVSLEG